MDDRPIYRAIKLIATGKYTCPVPYCAGNASTKWSLGWHFNDCHPQDLVVILSKGTTPLLKCKRCGMQMEHGALNRWHQCTKLCQDGWDRKVQHEADETARIALAQLFMAYRDKLERVEVLNIWVGCWCTMTMIPRLCKQTWHKCAL
jgi:hypothetical protein